MNTDEITRFQNRRQITHDAVRCLSTRILPTLRSSLTQAHGAAVHPQVYAGIDKRYAFGLSQPASIVNPQEYQGIITPSHQSDRTYIFLILRIFTILPVSSGRA